MTDTPFDHGYHFKSFPFQSLQDTPTRWSHRLPNTGCPATSPFPQQSVVVWEWTAVNSNLEQRVIKTEKPEFDIPSVHITILIPLCKSCARCQPTASTRARSCSYLRDFTSIWQSLSDKLGPIFFSLNGTVQVEAPFNVVSVRRCDFLSLLPHWVAYKSQGSWTGPGRVLG